MNARLRANLYAAGITSPEMVTRKPVSLTPIPWGKPDKELATGVLRSLAAMTPRHAIPFNTVLNRRLREFLHSHGVAK